MERLKIIQEFPDDVACIKAGTGEVTVGGHIEKVQQQLNRDPEHPNYSSPHYHRTGCAMDPGECPALSPYSSSFLIIYFCEAISTTTERIRREIYCGKMLTE